MANLRVGRRSGLVFRGGRNRRESRWLDVPLQSAVFVGGAAQIANSLTVAELALRPFTVVRTRMEYFMRSDQAAAREDQNGAAGFAVVSDQAVAIGVTAVPTPVTDLASDLWFAHEVMWAAGSSVNDGQVGFGFTIDSRAMRKVEDGQDIVHVLESSGLNNGMVWFSGGRVLIKLH